MIERGYSGELREAEQRIAGPRQRRGFLSCPVSPISDFRTLGTDQCRFANRVNIFDHIHAFEHGLTVVFHQDRDLTFANETYECLAVVVEHHGFPAGAFALEGPSSALGNTTSNAQTYKGASPHQFWFFAFAGTSLRFAKLSMSLTAVVCEIGNERVHGLKPGRINHRAAVAPNRYESCLAQSVQVECERVGRQSKATGDMACRHSLRPGLDQQAEYVKAA